MPTPPPAPKPLTIGVFDSGFGGLTVLRELLTHLPQAQFLYLGDSARLPYGSKSQETIARYAVSASRFLLDHGAGLLVIACNTATALALPEIRAAAAPIPVLGVIEPGAQAALALPNTSFPHILVLATAATVSSHAYARALQHLGLAATEKACPLLVPLVEEGWTDHPVTAEVARIYLAEAFAQAPDTSAVLLGCTHYPLLKPLLTRALADLGRPLPLIDSAHTTAAATAEAVTRLLLPTPLDDRANPSAPATLQIFATDSVEKFQHLGSRFLGQPLPPVQLVHLPE